MPAHRPAVAAPPPARPLGAQAAAALWADTLQANGNVSLVQIHDQRTAPGGRVRFKAILAQIERRLHRAPLFRQRLQAAPWGLTPPCWVDDAQFDLEYHVRHIALPQPGDWRQLCIQASRIHARALDLDRPLWEAYVIEGLDSFLDLSPGSFALLLKTHVAAVGLGELHTLTELLYDRTAQPPPPGPPVPWFAETAPSPWALAAQGVWQGVWQGVRQVGRQGLWSGAGAGALAQPLGRLARRAAPAASALAHELLHPAQHEAPATRFDSVVSPHRVFETRRFPERDIEAIRRLVPGASWQDAVLAVCGGALRQYLQAQGELPEGQDLRATVLAPPARGPGARAVDLVGPPAADAADGADGAATHAAAAPGGAMLALGTAEPDPVARLRQLRDARRAAAAAGQETQNGQKGQNGQNSQKGQKGPSAHSAHSAHSGHADATAGLAARGRAWVARAADALQAHPGRPTAPVGVVVVPAPARALYLCGARLSYTSALLPVRDGHGLALAITRYDGLVIVSPTCCRELMPDPEVFAQALRDSFQQCLALAQGRPSARRTGPSVKRVA